MNDSKGLAHPFGTGPSQAEPEEVSALRASVPCAAELRALKALREKASQGEWRIDRGIFGKGLWITTYLREMDFGERGRDGYICSVSTERVFSRPTRRGSHTHETETRPIKSAQDDAELICGAINLIGPMIDALLGPGQVDETAWLIEWPADKYNPLRYFAAGEQAVMSANDATRFSRKQDAEAMLRGQKIIGGRVVEHMWINPRPAQAIEAGTVETAGLDPKDESAVGTMRTAPPDSPIEDQ